MDSMNIFEEAMLNAKRVRFASYGEIAPFTTGMENVKREELELKLLEDSRFARYDICKILTYRAATTCGQVENDTGETITPITEEMMKRTRHEEFIKSKIVMSITLKKEETCSQEI